MATQYPNNLEITVEQPADTRFSAKDVAERNSFKYLYPGLLTYVRGEKRFYYYDGEWKSLIVDGLTSGETDRALSAKQGKVLKTSIDNLTGYVTELMTQIGNDITNIISTRNDLEVGSGTAISNTKDFYKHTATDGADVAITLGTMSPGKVKEVLLVIDNASSKTINLSLPNDDTAIFINNMDEMFVSAESTSEFSFLIDTTGDTLIIRVAGLIKE